MANSGIYKILNWSNGKMYIGSATYLRKRINDHKCSLQKGKHSNRHLQAAYNKYGKLNFQFLIIEYCEKEKLIEREQFWMDNNNCISPNGYNLAHKAGNTSGVKWTEEQRIKWRSKRIGYTRTQEEKDKISLSMKGKKNRLGTRHTEETRLKMGDANRRRLGNDLPIVSVLMIK
jgi:group I intron endonuclease